MSGALSYDLIVIGAGPAGEKAAAKAAYFKKKVAIVEKAPQPGGAGINTGTLPSKTLKETALYFSGKFEKGLYGAERTLDKNLSIDDFFFRKESVRKSEVAAINKNLADHKIDVYHGEGVFEDAHTVRVIAGLGGMEGPEDKILQGSFILIATGSYPFHPPTIPFDFKRVHDSDSILNLSRFPTSLCVIGAGVIGCEYTTIFATMGMPVHLIEGRDFILPFLDREISAALVKQMEGSGATVHFNAAVKTVEVPPTDAEPLVITLESGKKIEVDMLLYAAGRSGTTARLRSDKAGVKLGKREVIEVNADYQSSVPHIYAVGDAIGFPALASTSMDQGRVAVGHMFGIDGADMLARLFPYGIYTVPEVSMVGMTEEEAQKQQNDGKLEYGTGLAHHRSMARGKIMGVKEGFLKLIYERPTKKILGVHIIGPLASELIHYGMTLVEQGKTLDELTAVVFNYPSLHDLYKYAAYDGLGNLRGYKMREV
ncbi:MAG: Si-specific NAD(P)(+) transhydrogenase [Spirochaetia bacterium]|nr:Si-specific NAD(P)(+) transhydrogenase [Spirochaetia bacterium]